MTRTDADMVAVRELADEMAGAGPEPSLARAWYRITTDTRGTITPAAAEAADLALWTGRLAYADPNWTPALGRHDDRGWRARSTFRCERP